MLRIVAVCIVGRIVVMLLRVLARSSLVNIIKEDSNASHQPLILVNSYIKGRFSDAVRRLHEIGFDATQIVVVVGASPSDNVFVTDTHVQVNVTHNSIDFTALIAWLEHKECIDESLGVTTKSMFYMHDTCIIGERFHTLLSQRFTHKTTRLVSNMLFPLVKSCNMGIYSFEDILYTRDTLLRLKNNDLDRKALVNVKNIGFLMEDVVFNEIGTRNAYDLMFIPTGRRAGRTHLYVPSLDLTKLQANISFETIGIPIRFGSDTKVR